MAPVSIPQELASRLHREAEAARWGLSVERFAATLSISAEKGLGDRARSPRDVEGYLTGLHLRDLAVASACLEGNDTAWEFLIREHRQGLYRAAAAMRAGAGEELADALYAELFGVSRTGQAKTSLLRYFHGRSSLSTWMRAVLAQRHVDAIRTERRLESLPEEGGDDPAGDHSSSLGAAATAAWTSPPGDPERRNWMSAVHRALAAAIAALAAKDRLRLSLYYAESLTLAEIGRGLGEHEATVSRHLTRTRKAVREAAERHLREAEGMTQSEIAECLASVSADAGTLDLAALINAPPAGPAAGGGG